MVEDRGSMRLEFPKAGRPAVTLEEGATLIGSAPDCDVVLGGAGVAAHHCRIERHAGATRLHILDVDANTVVNGRRVDGSAILLQAGDVLLVGSVGCVLARPSLRNTARSRQAAVPPPVPPARPAGEPTQVRSVLPRLVLRGISGPTLGRGFPVRDGMLFGRNRDCDVFIESQEISRRHARLQVSGSGIRIEDLGSTNGTFVNGKRADSAMLQPGDELALDNVRFVLIEPGADAAPRPAPARRGWRTWMPLLLVLLLALLGLWLGWQWR